MRILLFIALLLTLAACGGAGTDSSQSVSAEEVQENTSKPKKSDSIISKQQSTQEWKKSINNFTDENFNWLIKEFGGYLQLREEVKISGTSVKAANIIRFYPNGKLLYGVCPIDYTPDSNIPSSEDCRKGTWSITQSWDGSPYTASTYGLNRDASYFLIDLDLAAGYRLNEIVNRKKTKALVYDLSKNGILYITDVMESPILNEKSYYANDNKSTFDMLVEGAFLVPSADLTSTPFMKIGSLEMEQGSAEEEKKSLGDIYSTSALPTIILIVKDLKGNLLQEGTQGDNSETELIFSIDGKQIDNFYEFGVVEILKDKNGNFGAYYASDMSQVTINSEIIDDANIILNKTLFFEGEERAIWTRKYGKSNNSWKLSKCEGECK